MRKSNSRIHERKARTFTPISVSLELTQRCNLTCIHCYNFSSPRTNVAYDVDALKERINVIASLNIPEIWLTGGEPTLSKDLSDIILYAHSRLLRVNLSTNGCFSVDDARRLADTPITQVRVSLDGWHEDNDYLRGFGTFKKAIDGLRRLTQRNVQVGIALHVRRRMKIGIDKTITKLSEFANSIHIGPILPFGRARLRLDLCLDEDEFSAFVNGLDNCSATISISDISCSALRGVTAFDVFDRQILCCLRKNFIISESCRSLVCRTGKIARHFPTNRLLNCINCCNYLK